MNYNGYKTVQTRLESLGYCDQHISDTRFCPEECPEYTGPYLGPTITVFEKRDACQYMRMLGYCPGYDCNNCSAEPELLE